MAEETSSKCGWTEERTGGEPEVVELPLQLPAHWTPAQVASNVGCSPWLLPMSARGHRLVLGLGLGFGPWLIGLRLRWARGLGLGGFLGEIRHPKVHGACRRNHHLPDYQNGVSTITELVAPSEDH